MRHAARRGRGVSRSSPRACVRLCAGWRGVPLVPPTVRAWRPVRPFSSISTRAARVARRRPGAAPSPPRSALLDAGRRARALARRSADKRRRAMLFADKRARPACLTGAPEGAARRTAAAGPSRTSAPEKRAAPRARAAAERYTQTASRSAREAALLSGARTTASSSARIPSGSSDWLKTLYLTGDDGGDGVRADRGAQQHAVLDARRRKKRAPRASTARCTAPSTG